MTGTPRVPGESADRRVTPDRRITPSVLCQDTLARIVTETSGEDFHAGRALTKLERRRVESGLASGDDEIIIHSLRGRWLVGAVGEIRQAMQADADAASRRLKQH
jgi:hypothetical protein